MTSGNAPFLNIGSFDREVEEAPPLPVTAAAWSPFVSVYEGADDESYDEPTREAYTTVVNALYDEEFNEFLPFELLTDARNLHQDHLATGHSVAEADRLLTEHFAQLTREAELMIDAVAREFGPRNDALVADEVESFVQRYTPATPLDPPFQEWLGSLVKKVAKGVRAAAGTAIKGIATFGFGPALGLVKKLFLGRILKRVLQLAIGRLPVAVRPAARLLAQRLGFAAPAALAAPATPVTPAAPAEPGAAPADVAAAAALPPEAAGSPVQASAAPTVSEMQLEFDELLAEALLADDEVALELEAHANGRRRTALGARCSPISTRPASGSSTTWRTSARARAPRRTKKNFLPALTAIRLVMKVTGGRPRLVGLLGGGDLEADLEADRARERAGALARHRRRWAEAHEPRGARGRDAARHLGGGGDRRGDGGACCLTPRLRARQRGATGGLHAGGIRAGGGREPPCAFLRGDLPAAARLAGGRRQRGVAHVPAASSALQAVSRTST